MKIIRIVFIQVQFYVAFAMFSSVKKRALLDNDRTCRNTDDGAADEFGGTW